MLALARSDFYVATLCDHRNRRLGSVSLRLLKWLIVIAPVGFVEAPDANSQHVTESRGCQRTITVPSRAKSFAVTVIMHNRYRKAAYWIFI